MKRFVTGVSRDQATLFPERLDDFVAEDNPVRAVDAFIEALDLRSLGFNGVDPNATGRPGYHPAMLLKLYVYGYLNRIQSSRRLERESQRNVELMWLTERLSPDFKTIADFRKDNGKAIANVCRQFVDLCRRLALFSQAIVAIDGSKFKAINNGDLNFTPGRIRQQRKRIEQHIARYLTDLKAADRASFAEPESRASGLKQKLARLRQEIEKLDAVQAVVQSAPGKQVAFTDPEARVMATQRKNSGVVGYNVQVAVEPKHHLIVAHEVTNDVTDRAQLPPMAKQARAAMGTLDLTAVADRAYFSGTQLLACSAEGIRALVPKPRTSRSRGRGLFPKDDFRYEPEQDQYRCPAGEVRCGGCQHFKRTSRLDRSDAISGRGPRLGQGRVRGRFRPSGHRLVGRVA